MDAKRKNETVVEMLGDRAMLVTRTFNGPPRIVFDAWSKAEHVARWWAPKSRGVEVVSIDAEVKTGGKYRYVLKHGAEHQFAFSGKYLDVTPGSRLVYTSLFEPHSSEVVVVATFNEVAGGKTELVCHELYPSPEVREAAVSSGMESGLRETIEQLEELIASLR